MLSMEVWKQCFKTLFFKYQLISQDICCENVRFLLPVVNTVVALRFQAFPPHSENFFISFYWRICLETQQRSPFVSKSVSGYFSFLDRVKKLLVCSTSDLAWMDFKGSFPNSHMGIGKFSIILDFLEVNIWKSGMSSVENYRFFETFLSTRGSF